MIKTILEGKYDIDSFSYNEYFEVKISTEKKNRLLNFGDTIVVYVIISDFIFDNIFLIFFF